MSAEEMVQEIQIQLSDEGVTVNGEAISEDADAAVYAGADLIYYEAEKGSTYGAGSAADEHTADEAAEHTVITITQPGTYRVSGQISKGQIAIDLGEESREDETAVVNLILDQADITCTAASAIVVYNAYECGSDDTETASMDVDTAAAGFNLILADDSENKVQGSHVAKIYRDGTTQEQVDASEAKKKWKFDGAIDSLVSLNIDGESADNGKLIVTADNEGISSALHMTINGGEIAISAADDAINTSEDDVSVFTMNDGILSCDAGGGAEGDGIDSNGWLIINGGVITSCANGSSPDSGLDSDRGIYINGGTVFASGNMYDQIQGDSEQKFLALTFGDGVSEGQLLLLKNSAEEAVAAFEAKNDFTILIYSDETITDEEYTLYAVSSVTGDLEGGIYRNITDYTDAEELEHTAFGMMGKGDGFMPRGQMQLPEGMEPGEMPEMPEMPEGMEPGERPEMPEGMEPGERPEMPEGMEPGERPEMPEGQTE